MWGAVPVTSARARASQPRRCSRGGFCLRNASETTDCLAGTYQGAKDRPRATSARLARTARRARRRRCLARRASSATTRVLAAASSAPAVRQAPSALQAPWRRPTAAQGPSPPRRTASCAWRVRRAAIKAAMARSRARCAATGSRAPRAAWSRSRRRARGHVPERDTRRVRRLPGGQRVRRRRVAATALQARRLLRCQLVAADGLPGRAVWQRAGPLKRFVLGRMRAGLLLRGGQRECQGGAVR